MKKLSTLLFAVCFTLMMYAVPAKPGLLTVTQADGTTIEMYLHGDEVRHFTTSQDGLLIKANDQGNYEYAQMVNGLMKCTGVAFHAKAQRSAQEVAFIQGLDSEITSVNATLHKLQTSATPHRVSAEFGVSPNKVPKGFAILVNFADKAFVTADANAKIDSLLNEKGYSVSNSIGSVKDYFTDASNGQYSPSFDVYGPYTLPKNMASYGGNDYSGQDKDPVSMIVEACKLADSAGVDFTQYDGDGDGVIDNVYVFYAGYGEASGASKNTIWPHSWNCSYDSNYPLSTRLVDGKEIDRYACSSELNNSYGSVLTGISTFAHEFGHVLGLPDFYDTYYSTNEGETLNQWDIMDMGPYNEDGFVPPTYSAYERWFMEWCFPTVLPTDTVVNIKHTLVANKTYMITPGGRSIAKASDARSSEYIYLIENRQASSWDAPIGGEGLLIERYIYVASDFKNNMPNNGTPMEMDIMEADGTPGYYSIGGDAYPGTSDVSSFTKATDYPISNITTLLDNSINFTVGSPTAVDQKAVNTPIVLQEDHGVAIQNLEVGAQIKIYDLMGRLVENSISTSTTEHFSSYAGIYIVKITSSMGNYNFKTIIK